MARKTVYYSDPLRDDFAKSNGKIHARAIDENYRYEHCLFWRICSFILYYFVAFPIVLLSLKLLYGLKIRNRKAVRNLKGGFVYYGNHTNGFPDATAPSVLAFPRRADVITGPEAVSLPGFGTIVAMLGAVPLPKDFTAAKHFMNALKKRSARRGVFIYPEAHIWPYYTGIRPFQPASFQYPFLWNKPVIAGVTTYRQRKVFKSLPPKITITLSDPFDPADHRNKDALRDAVHAFMLETASKDNYSYIDYIERQKTQS